MHSTTLTLDNDIVARLKQLSLMRKDSFKQTINKVLQAGLVADYPQHFAARTWLEEQ